MFLTLTLPGVEHRTRDVDDLHWDIGGRWNRLRGELVRRYRERFGYVWVRESHKSGVPHLHLVIVASGLAREVRECQAELDSMGALGSARNIAPKGIRELAMRCGFGPMVDASLVRSQNALDDYLTKTLGEITKDTQLDSVPLNARCYGASLGMLPKREKSGNTGWLEATEQPGEPLLRPRVKARSKYDDIDAYVAAWDRATAHAARRFQLGPRPTACVDPSQPLAFFPSVEDAREYAHGLAPPDTPARTYQLKHYAARQAAT